MNEKTIDTRAPLTKQVDDLNIFQGTSLTIPDVLLENIKYNGKPYFPAVVILSDILYWYRGSYERSEDTGEVVRRYSKFKADALQRNFKYYESRYGLTAKQCRTAHEILESMGLIIRQQRTVETTQGTRLGNVPFVIPVIEEIAGLYLVPCRAEGCALEGNSSSPVGQDITKNTTENTTETSTKESEDKSSSLKEKKKDPLVLVDYLNYLMAGDDELQLENITTLLYSCFGRPSLRVTKLKELASLPQDEFMERAPDNILKICECMHEVLSKDGVNRKFLEARPNTQDTSKDFRPADIIAAYMYYQSPNRKEFKYRADRTTKIERQLNNFFRKYLCIGDDLIDYISIREYIGYMRDLEGFNYSIKSLINSEWVDKARREGWA
jgi:hypothetical protein